MTVSSAWQFKLNDALQGRLDQTARLGDRASYIGASEVGNCLRRVVLSKLNPIPFDLPSMGRMLAGRALENEVVQLVRTSLKGSLRNTGRNQLEAIHQKLPFRGHPDGRIVGEDGDGVLEVKTASASTFKRYRTEGLPQLYLDQVQAQLGLAGLKWGIVVLVSRENLAEVQTFQVDFSPVAFEFLEGRASTAAEALKAESLPAGEPERGFCFNCPYAKDCPAYQAQRRAIQEVGILDVQRLEFECQMEELAGLESTFEPMQQRITELRERLKEHLLEFGLSRVVLDGGVLQLVTSSRSSLDGKALQREAPEVYQRFLRTSTFSTLRVTHHGDNQ